MTSGHVGLGTVVQRYPRDAWRRIPADIDLNDVWQLVGPQVDQHVRGLPLWKVFCLVYIEGLAHGSASAGKEPKT